MRVKGKTIHCGLRYRRTNPVLTQRMVRLTRGIVGKAPCIQSGIYTRCTNKNTNECYSELYPETKTPGVTQRKAKTHGQPETVKTGQI